jgi:hypothetical protein
MSIRRVFQAGSRVMLGVALLAVMAMLPIVAIGGFNGFRNGAVGGISVDPNGVVSNVKVEDRDAWRQAVIKTVKRAPEQLNRPVEMRMVSLKGLESALVESRNNQQMELPDEVKFLAGLQRIQYVLVVPEEKDILLVGPGEGWKVNDQGDVVGVTTGRPVLQLEDLIVVFRSMQTARNEGISCSIDPTPGGRQSLDRFLKTQKVMRPDTLQGIQKALGPQEITLKGIPTDSHVARVLVAADYHMKRLAMNLEKAPIANFPGFLDLLVAKKARLDNMMPRWWLACNYEPLVRSEDSLTWELRGPGVKAMTEDDIIAADGTVTGSGRKSHVAEEWAKQMTAKYDALSEKNAIFGDLRNIMDVCVITALIDKENLIGKAGASFPLLTGKDDSYATLKWPTPKQLDTQCSFIKRGGEYVITASGGVQVDSYGVASRVTVNDDIAKVRPKALNRSQATWWWN